MLAAAARMLLDDLDDAFAEGLGGAQSLLERRVHRFEMELIVLLVHGIGDAVAEQEQTIAGFQLRLLGRERAALDNAQRQTNGFLGRRLFGLRGVAANEKRGGM